MKVRSKKGSKHPKKIFIPFKQEDRIDYVTGFHRRKKERKEKGRIYNEAKARKNKLIARAERRKKAKALLDAYEENAQKKSEFLSDSDCSSEDEASSVAYSGTTGAATVTDVVTTVCGGATVEISTLGLRSNHFLGHNTDFSNCKLDSSSLMRRSTTFNRPMDSLKKEKVATEDQSFSDLVKNMMKSVKKKAKKTGKKYSFNNTDKYTKVKVQKKKKKPLVTEL